MRAAYLATEEQLRAEPANFARPTTRTLVGRVGARGECRGIARLVLTLDDVAELRRDEIAVIRCDAYAFLCAKLASAVVAEHGASPFGTAATHARAARVPCVVGVGNATRVVQTGERLYVRCDSKGATVTRLDAPVQEVPVMVGKQPVVTSYLAKIHHDLLLYQPSSSGEDTLGSSGVAFQLSKEGFLAKLPPQDAENAAYVPIVTRGFPSEEDIEVD